MLPGVRARLRVAPRHRSQGAVQACPHARLKVALEVVESASVVLIHVVEPHLDADHRLVLVVQLVHQPDSCDHVGRLDAAAHHAEDNVVPELVHGASAQRGLQLQLEVPAFEVGGVFPLGAHTLPEDHQGVHDGLDAILLPGEPLAIQQLAGLREVVPASPKLLDRAEGSRLLGCVSIVGLLVLRLHVLLPDGPGVLQLRVHLFHLLEILRPRPWAEVCAGGDLRVEAEVGRLIAAGLRGRGCGHGFYRGGCTGRSLRG
mmetsp:Transcript_76406/g.247421  ORF Transcript_76406/g.247421 Transcript_76406/m.247421 type:complete len:259 (+) Transcript_76406:203-979(+)